jgi:flagella basal body P-ring formation protein FlgA
MVNVVSAKRVERRLPVSVTVRRFGPVVVAARPLERHAVLTAADVRLERMETTMLQSGYCTAPDALTGKRLKRMFAEGSVLYSGTCELVPLIHQGDLVTLIVRAGSVVLSARATAKQDGSKGEMINVQREGTHDRIKASVLDRGIVEALID